MNEQEKLIELLSTTLWGVLCDHCGADKGSDKERVLKITAEYLLNNGVIMLPCKVGDTVWVKSSPNNITECKVYNICTNIYADNHEGGGTFWKGFEIKSDDMGKTVFLTREEAERALKTAHYTE